MDKNIISDAVCGIDEKYLSGYDNSVNKKKMKKNMNKKIIAAAACSAVVAATGTALYFGGAFDKKPLPVSGTAVLQPDEPVTVHDLLSQPAAEDPQNGAPSLYAEQAETPSVPEEQPPEAENGDAAFAEAPVTAAEVEQNKGGDTSGFLQRYAVGNDGGYYEIFRPGIDVFNPNDDMTLENRFCDVEYNGLSYYPAPDGELTEADFGPEVLGTVKSVFYELRSANAEDEISGIQYNARVEIHRLPETDTNEAIACVISFNGETKAYKYLCAHAIEQSRP